MNRRSWLFVALLALVPVVVFVVRHGSRGAAEAEAAAGAGGTAAAADAAAAGEAAAAGGGAVTAADGPAEAPAAGDDSVAGEEPESAPEPEADEADEAERRVEAFDALTDAWMEGVAKRKVAMADIDEFAKHFRAIPRNRQDECLHRALNLIPDENVMLLAGILLDKTLEQECIELVFNDILNRSEEVKKPILEEIFKDKSHPCWADTAWIFDATGEVPKAK